MIRSDTLLLRLRLSRWRAFLRSCWGCSIRSRIGCGLALLVVCACGVEGVRRHGEALVSGFDSRAMLSAIVAATLALLAGWGTGRGAMGGARRDLASPWLAVLPWSNRERRRALLLACTPSYGLLLGLGMGMALLQGGVAGWAETIWSAPIGLVLVSVGFACGCLPVQARAIAVRLSPAATRGAARLVGLERMRPRWLGDWALAGRGGRVVAFCFASLAGLGGLGITGSIQTGTAWPAALTGLCGGHLVFLFALRCQPLRATALRVLPLRFRHAVWGVARLPLALSLGWFAPPGLVAFAVAPSDPVAMGCLIGLLTLDGLALVAFVWLADSPAAAMLLHATALLMAGYYAPRLGISEAILALVLAALLWHGAKRRFVRGPR